MLTSLSNCIIYRLREYPFFLSTLVFLFYLIPNRFTRDENGFVWKHDIYRISPEPVYTFNWIWIGEKSSNSRVDYVQTLDWKYRVYEIMHERYLVPVFLSTIYCPTFSPHFSFFPLSLSPSSSLLTFLCFRSCGGWTSAGQIAGEIRNPKKSFNVAVFLVLFLTLFFSLLPLAIAMGVNPTQEAWMQFVSLFIFVLVLFFDRKCRKLDIG